MKKLVFMFVMCAAFALTSCFNKTEEAQPAPENDSVTVVEGDSTVATEKAEEVKTDAQKEEATKEEAVKEETPATEAAPAEEKVEK